MQMLNVAFYAKPFVKTGSIKIKEIMHIDNMRLQTILLMTHIDLMQWNEIEDKTGISIQHLQKLRRDGENLITIETLLKSYMSIEQKVLDELEKIKNGNLICLLQ